MTAKFKVGDKVRCKREENDAFYGFDFEGEVEWVNCVDDDEYEYRVSNAPTLGFVHHPLLIWEEEMEAAE